MQGNSLVSVAYVHNIHMISHSAGQLAPWLLFDGLNQTMSMQSDIIDIVHFFLFIFQHT